jgi:glutamate synthase domain-containing protein 2
VAYELEAALIQQYGRAKIDENGTLTNICVDNRPPNLKGIPGKSPDEQTRQKISLALKNKTNEEKENAKQKLRETLSQRTEEEKEAIRHKLQETLKRKTEQEKEETRRRLRETLSQRTEEEEEILRQKMSAALTGRINGSPSEETKQKIGDAQRGKKNHRYGKHWSEEEKRCRSEWNKTNGIKPPVRCGPMSEEQKAAIGKGNTGKKRTPEQSAYLSSIRKGKTRKKPLSDETKEKIRLANIAAKADKRLSDDLIGIQVDSWIVIDKGRDLRPKIRGSNGIYWKCRCSLCNKEKEIQQAVLVNGARREM